jgi:ribokinase
VGSPVPSLGVIGSANVDVVLVTDALPGPGETVLARDLRHLVGGKGANQAVAAARLGATTAFLGCVGDDPDGDRAIASLVADGVDVVHVSRSVRPTGTALVVTAAGGDNFIVVSSGANSDLDLSGVALAEYDGLLIQLEVPLSLVADALAGNDRVVVNASPARAEDLSFLDRCSAVIVNEQEARHIAVAALERCIITRGPRGAQHVCRGEILHDVAAPSVDTVDTVGAGDAFAAAYADRLLSGDSDVDALRYSVAAGTIATLGRGARGSLPTDGEVREWLRRGW